MEIGIAGWALHRSIRELKTMTLLDFPALARQEFAVSTIELVSSLFEGQSAPYLNRLREEIERHHLRVANIAVDTGSLASQDEAVRRTDLETIKQWFYVARAVGADAIRVNTGTAAPDDLHALERVIAGYQELAAHGAEAGVKLLIENHGGVSSDPHHIATILEHVAAPWFGTCPDVGNFPGGSWDEGMTVMAPRAAVVHIKIMGYDPSGWQRAVARDGTDRSFDLKGSLAILHGAGYQGPLNFEYNLAEDDERTGITKGIAYLRDLLTTL
jgi:sugar phosphate isomerase/epimerase